MKNLREEIAKFAGNEDVENAVCEILNCEKAEVDSEGRIWVSGNVLDEERTSFVWNHPIMN